MESYILGYDIDAPLATGSNQLSIGNLIFGTGIDGTGTTVSSGLVGIGTTTPTARLSVTQSANTSAGGFYIAETGDTDFRSVYMNTSGVMSFYGGDTAGALNTATLDAAGAWVNASDIAYKENIEDLSYGLNELMELKPRHYKMKGLDLEQIGFIAQEIELVVPEVVGGEEGSKGISYGNLLALVVKSVQELNEKIINSSQYVSNQSSALSSQITGTFDGLLDWISDKVVRAKEFVGEEARIEKVRMKKIEMEDANTGEIYCTWIENGEWIKTKGECQEQTPMPTSASTPTPEITPAPAQEPISTPTSDVNPTPAPTPLPSPESTPEPTPTPTPEPTPAPQQEEPASALPPAQEQEQ